MKIKDELQKVFHQVFDDDTIELFPEMTSNDIEDWDSLMHINLIVAIEKKFAIKFFTQDITDTKNVGKFLQLIEKKLTA